MTDTKKNSTIEAGNAGTANLNAERAEQFFKERVEDYAGDVPFVAVYGSFLAHCLKSTDEDLNRIAKEHVERMTGKMAGLDFLLEWFSCGLDNDIDYDTYMTVIDKARNEAHSEHLQTA
jgi:hypothetical protein